MHQAVVVGGGMAGMCAAEVLSHYFSHVVLLERDTPQPVWQQSAVEMVKAKHARPGVAQYNQLHVLTAKGLATIDDIFGGRYMPALRAAGGSVIDICTQFMTMHPTTGFQPWPRRPHARPLLAATCSRHCLESTARQLVAANAKVSVMFGAAAAGLVFGADAGRAAARTATGSKAAVTGVLLADGTSLPAALVVDCSGRGSAVPAWLEAAGYERPRMSRVTSTCGYAGWFVQLAPGVEAALQAADVQAVAMLSEPPKPTVTFALLLHVEGGLWMASVGGNEGVHPPRRDEDLVDFAVAKVWHPAIGQLLSGSTPLAPATRCYGLSSTWRHYESLTLPEGLLMLGDSIASFSPVYAQGMTVAAIEVAALNGLLSKRAAQRRAAAAPVSNKPSNSAAACASASSFWGPDSNAASLIGMSGSSSSSSSRSSSGGGWLLGLPGEFMQAVLPTVKAAWGLAAANDMRFEGSVSNEPRSSALYCAVERLMLGYLSTVFKLAPNDKVVHESLLRVLQLFDGPEALLQPKVLMRVLLHHLTALLNPSSTAAAAAATAEKGGIAKACSSDLASQLGVAVP